MPGIGKCEKLPLDKKQITQVPHKPVTVITAPIPCQSNPNLQLKVANWKFWAYTDGSCQVQDSKTVIRAGVHHPMSDSKILVEPNGAYITNTIGRDGLAAIAALTNEYTHTMPRTASAHFTNSESKPCIQRSTETLSNLARTSQSHIYFYKVKPHAGISGNGCADRIAKYQADLKDNNMTDTGIPGAGPGNNPFYSIAWLAWEEARPSTHT
eukprot:445922-Pelagomonas_calceolata.AAC.1